MAAEGLHLGRRLVVADAFLGLGEIALIGYPLYDSYFLDAAQWRIFTPAFTVAFLLGLVVWVLALRGWLLPLLRAADKRLAGRVLEREERAAAYDSILKFPKRAFALRVVMLGLSGITLAGLLYLRAGFPLERVFTVFAIASSHGFAISIFRAVIYARILERARLVVLPDLDDLRRFADTYKWQLLVVAFASGALGVAAIGTFTWFFIPLNLEHYLRLETYFPISVGVLCLLWGFYFKRIGGPIDRYLEAALAPRPVDQPGRDDPRAILAYRVAQAIPYKMALSKGTSWLMAVVLFMAQAVLFFNVDLENAALIAGEAIVVTIGVALYEALWHRVTMRPLLTLIAARHRPSPEMVRTPLSLRAKMLFGFGLLTAFACGLSLFWSFMQYKTMATVFIQRESELRLEVILSDLKQLGAQQGQTLERAQILSALQKSATQFAPTESVHDHAVVYYLPPESGAQPIGVGGGKGGAPPLPWTGEALLRRLDRGHMELSQLRLTGAYARLYLAGRDAGAIALLLPGYRGRGPSTVPQIRVLISFFLVLLITSMAVVILIATDLAGPIRELERRAGAMAKGDLSRPVITTAGEGDEVGRLSFAFEEMRRALNDKLRSSTEINLSLEAEVERRTAELERRNREIAEALEQLQRAQDELVRSEKMASMGRLVAGIAHEINNPVNAVVNSAGPLAETLDALSSRGVDPATIHDVKEMLAVIQRGAHRTKEIVQALHNYSRGDDDRVVEVDLQRSIDETLDLLRHHLKNGITVERQYGVTGKVLGRTTLNQVFMNLLTNAAQALGDKGRIIIRTEQQDGKVIITIADDGPGISPDILPRIFDPFFTTKDVGEGSGLGLSIVHGIVERHGGTISVSSDLGKGTSFTVTLPQTKPSGDPQHSQPQA